MAETMTGPEAAAYYSKLVAARANAICGEGLEVTIKRTTHSFRCHQKPGHADLHRTPQGSTWMTYRR